MGKSISVTKKPGEEPKKVVKWDAKKYFLKRSIKKVLPSQEN